jgi:hypothetical protein
MKKKCFVREGSFLSSLVPGRRISLKCSWFFAQQSDPITNVQPLVPTRPLGGRSNYLFLHARTRVDSRLRLSHLLGWFSVEDWEQETYQVQFVFISNKGETLFWSPFYLISQMIQKLRDRRRVIPVGTSNPYQPGDSREESAFPISGKKEI